MSKRIRFPFAENGDRTAIQDVTQPSGIINYQDGYPAAYSLDIVTDPTARRVNRDRFNQLMFDITSNIKEWQEQSFPAYIQPSSNGNENYAYPKGMTVRFNGGYRVSLVDNNDTQPDNASNWADAFPLPVALGGTGVETINELKTALGVPPQATQQEALDGADVDAYMPPDLVHAAFNQYGLGVNEFTPSSILSNTSLIDPKETGFYRYSDSCTEKPSLESGEVVWINRSNTVYSAIAIDQLGNVYFGRNGAPGFWIKSITENDKATTAQAQAGTDDEAYLTSKTANDALDMVGFVMFSSTDATPDGRWIKGNGFEISRTAYADLFAKASTSVNFISQATKDADPETYAGYYGDGDGSTTFTIPDLRAEFIRGFDDGRGSDSDRGFGSWQKGSFIPGDDGLNSEVVSVYLSGNKTELGWDEFTGYDEVQADTVVATAPMTLSSIGGFTGHGGASRPRNIAYTAWIRY